MKRLNNKPFLKMFPVTVYLLIVVIKVVPRPALLLSTVLPVDFPSNHLLIMESHLYS